MHFHDKSQVYKARHAIRSTFYDSPPNQISRRNTISVPCARRESGAWSKISKGSPSECLARMRASQDAELSRLPRHLNAQLTIIRWDGDEMRRELSFWLSLTARSVSYERYLAPTIIVKETVLARRPAYKVPSPGHGRINEDLRHSVGERDGSSRPRGSGCDASEERLLNYNFFKIYGNATPLFYHYSALPIFFLPSLPNDVTAADLATLRTGIGASEHASGIIEGRGAMQEHEEIIMDSPWGATSETLRRLTGHHEDGKFLSSNKIFSGITSLQFQLKKNRKKMVDTKSHTWLRKQLY